MVTSRLVATLAPVLLLLTSCAGGTEAARVGGPAPGDSRPRASAGVAPRTGPLGAPVTCRAAPSQLTRDWTRLLVARGTDYYPQRLAVVRRDITELSRLGGSCPGDGMVPALLDAVDRLPPAGNGTSPADTPARRDLAAAGDRWLASRDSQARFAPP